MFFIYFVLWIIPALILYLITDGLCKYRLEHPFLTFLIILFFPIVGFFSEVWRNTTLDNAKRFRKKDGKKEEKENLQELEPTEREISVPDYHNLSIIEYKKLLIEQGFKNINLAINEKNPEYPVTTVFDKTQYKYPWC